MRTRLALIALVALTACGTPNAQSTVEPGDTCDPATCVTLPGDTGESRAATSSDAAGTSDTLDTLDGAALRAQALVTGDTFPVDTVPTVPSDTTPIDTVPGDTTTTIPGDTAPTFSGVSVPASVSAGSTITFEWTVTDPEGVDVTTARVGGPSGWVSWCTFPMIGTRISGSATDGTYRATCNVPEAVPNGTYTVFFLSDGPGEAQRDFAIVGGSSDSGAPTISNISAPSSAQLGDSVTITWRAVDPSGVKYSIAWLANGGFASTSGVPVVDYGDYGVTRVSGDEFDGVYSQTVRFRNDSPTGTYSVWLSRADLLGNKVFDDTPVRITVSG